jgi:catechol 2,3-dioxygenase-like lactoylglutathione lyase family enzyme
MATAGGRAKWVRGKSMKLYMVELAVSDFPRAAEWYSRLLSMDPVQVDERNGFALFEVYGGRVALKVRTPAGKGMVLFEVEDLDEELARLESDAEVTVSAEGYRRAKLSDPDGNTVVLFEWV